MSKNKKNIYSDIIQAIDKTNKDNLVGIHIPSLGREVKFSPLTVSHQKQIISTALDTTVVNTTSHAILTSKIIKECCKEPEVTLYAMDRHAILIGLRVSTLGYDIVAQNANGDDVKTNIESHYKETKQIKPSENLLNLKKIQVNDIIVNFKPPTLDVDIEVNQKILPIVGKNIEDRESLKNIVADAIVYEYVKHVKSVEIGENHVDFDYNYARQLSKIIESLPMSVSREILKEINAIKRYEDKFTKITKDNNVLTIVTDARFYNSE